MSPDQFSAAITGLWQRIDTLQRRAHESGIQPSPLTTELLEELSSTLEELRAVEEELHQQTEELALSREALAAEHQRYRELFEFAPDGYVVTDPLGIIIDANHAAATLLNARREYFLRKPLNVFIAFDDRGAFRRQITWLQEGEGIREWEVRIQPRYKPTFPAVLSCTASRNAQRQVVGLRWLLRDISERKRAEEAIRQMNQVLERQVEERTLALQTLNDQLRQDIARRTAVETQLRASLREKEMLLREVHHRVKNNMQVVSSLLNLQASQADDARIRELLQESHRRIHAMALIHDTIYASSNLANIDLATFTTTLASYLVNSYALDSNRMNLHLQLDEVIVPPDVAVPYGLILNELVSNCLKHAFPEGQGGAIRITLQAGPTAQATLIVHDNGRGIPAAVGIKNPRSLGLQLVQALTEQLSGTITFEHDGGTAFILMFPLNA